MSGFPCSDLLVPMDFSDDSRRAFEYAAEVARSVGGRLTLLTVIEDAFPYPELFSLDHPDEEFYRSLRERALARMEEMVAALPDPVPVERVVVRGHPRQEICAMAEELGTDLIVMARHGNSGLRSALLGSTTETVLRSAGCPVLVLPPAVELTAE